MLGWENSLTLAGTDLSFVHFHVPGEVGRISSEGVVSNGMGCQGGGGGTSLEVFQKLLDVTHSAIV